jgi:uncharacterized protein DUF3108
MHSFVPQSRARSDASSRWHVRPALLVALGASIALHVLWSLWPVEFNVTPAPPPLSVTLEEMPAPLRLAPLPPTPEPTPLPAKRLVPLKPKPRPHPQHRPIQHAPVIAAPATRAPAIDTSPAAQPRAPAPSQTASAPVEEKAAPAIKDVVTGPPADDAKPQVVLPPRLDLAYKVFYGTQGFMVGAAIYRFEHDGDAYRISTYAEPRGLAALFVHGHGLLESRGTITATGLKPYELVIERGTSDKREVAYFDWDAGNVVLNDGELIPLDPPAYDPLTLLWQSYFSPPSRDDQRFTLVTPRRVTRYTFKLQAEEPVPWRNGEVMTQRWHQISDDGKTEAWFWLAPSMHYVPMKMRIARTSRGTVEALLAAIRTDAKGADVSEALGPEPEPLFKPSNPMAPGPGPDNTGQ